MGLYFWVRDISRSALQFFDHLCSASNKMPAAVKGAIQEALVSHGGQTEAEAQEVLTSMEREGRLVEDCWD